MVQNVLAEIKTGYEFLTKVEKKIADIILADPQKFTHLSMTELSEISGVSQGSINNFSKKFSSGGFSSLKLKLAGCIPSSEDKPFAMVDRTQSIKDAMEVKIRENIMAFRNTKELNSEENLEKAAQLILKAKRIEIYGVVHSGITATDLGYQLLKLGIPASFVNDTLMFAVSATMLNNESLVIAVSSSGRTKEIIDAVTIAKENNTPLIAITSNKFSPLAQMADAVLLTAPSGSTISDRVDEIRLSQLLIADTLCSYIRSLIDSSGKERYYKISQIMNSHSIKD